MLLESTAMARSARRFGGMYSHLRWISVLLYGTHRGTGGTGMGAEVSTVRAMARMMSVSF
jgi:hypothetical protein